MGKMRDKKVIRLVETNYKKMKFSLKHSNRIILREKCIREWEEESKGVCRERDKKLIEYTVNRLIPVELD